jgi:hypothetical protein
VAFLPWPASLQAELDLRGGRHDQATERFEHAWTLACQLGDPCWEGMAARGLGLASAAGGDQDAAAVWLAQAHSRCNRVTDRYHWVSGYVLDAMVAAALDRHDHTEAGRLVQALASLAARDGMRELVVRAHLHRARLGDPAAFEAARLLAEGVDNPALLRLVEAVPAG